MQLFSSSHIGPNEIRQWLGPVPRWIITLLDAIDRNFLNSRPEAANDKELPNSLPQADGH